jgi:hypothetical protein
MIAEFSTLKDFPLLLLLLLLHQMKNERGERRGFIYGE